MARPLHGNAQRADAGVYADAGDSAAPARIARMTAPAVRLVITDGSSLVTRVAARSWAGRVLAPLLLSIALDAPLSGAPLIGVALWLILLRVARWLSPAARADTLVRQGRYAEALAMCDQSLDVTGAGAGVGRRRLGWCGRTPCWLRRSRRVMPRFLLWRPRGGLIRMRCGGNCWRRWVGARSGRLLRSPRRDGC